MPIVARELGGIQLYGWVFSLFFLGDLVGIVIMGGLIDRGGLVRPFGLGLGLFAVGLLIGGTAASMPILIGVAANARLGRSNQPPAMPAIQPAEASPAAPVNSVRLVTPPEPFPDRCGIVRSSLSL